MTVKESIVLHFTHFNDSNVTVLVEVVSGNQAAASDDMESLTPDLWGLCIVKPLAVAKTVPTRTAVNIVEGLEWVNTVLPFLVEDKSIEGHDFFSCFAQLVFGVHVGKIP